MARSIRHHLTALFLMALALPTCAREPYGGTPVATLASLPGFLGEEALRSAALVAEQPVAGGTILLYRFQEGPADCLASAFVARPAGGRGQATSASRLHCQGAPGQNSPLRAAYSVSGRFTTVYGLAHSGAQAAVQWSDGRSSLVAIRDGLFLQTRSGVFQVRRVELLDGSSNVLVVQDGRNGPSLAAELYDGDPVAAH